MISTESESDLIAAAAAGDTQALERLLLEYYDRLLRRITRKLPPTLVRVVGAEDVLQQTYIEVFRSIQTFQPQGTKAFYRWLCTIAQHRIQDALKAHMAVKRGGGRREVTINPRHVDDSCDDLIDLLAGPERTPSHTAARHEAFGAMHVALASINEDYRRALQLRYVQGLEVADVAKRMHRSPHAIHHLCHRGLNELKVVLGRSSQFMTRK